MTLMNDIFIYNDIYQDIEVLQICSPIAYSTPMISSWSKPFPHLQWFIRINFDIAMLSVNIYSLAENFQLFYTCTIHIYIQQTDTQ